MEKDKVIIANENKEDSSLSSSDKEKTVTSPKGGKSADYPAANSSKAKSGQAEKGIKKPGVSNKTSGKSAEKKSSVSKSSDKAKISATNSSSNAEIKNNAPKTKPKTAAKPPSSGKPASGSGGAKSATAKSSAIKAVPGKASPSKSMSGVKSDAVKGKPASGSGGAKSAAAKSSATKAVPGKASPSKSISGVKSDPIKTTPQKQSTPKKSAPKKSAAASVKKSSVDSGTGKSQAKLPAVKDSATKTGTGGKSSVKSSTAKNESKNPAQGTSAKKNTVKPVGKSTVKPEAGKSQGPKASAAVKPASKSTATKTAGPKPSDKKTDDKKIPRKSESQKSADEIPKKPENAKSPVRKKPVPSEEISEPSGTSSKNSKTKTSAKTEDEHTAVDSAPAQPAVVHDSLEKSPLSEPKPTARADSLPSSKSVSKSIRAEVRPVPKSRRHAVSQTSLITRTFIIAVLLLSIFIVDGIMDQFSVVYADRVQDELVSQIEENNPVLSEIVPDEEPAAEEVIPAIISVSIPRKETYLPFEGSWRILAEVETVGGADNSVTWSSSDDNIATVEADGTVTGHANGVAIITATAQNSMSASTEVTVTDCIILPSYERKEFIPYRYYSEQEAEMMDRILFSRVADAGGYGTRGAVVAAARFITLEMPYMIPYFYENGRMDASPGRPSCDGEGRYYHVGLYLSETKYKDIRRSVAGPAFWGAPLTNFQNEGFFESGRQYPNGLDCSGFVSWVMINGGIDSGDIGAGYYDHVEREFYKIGERTTLTVELLKSGSVKSGDLIGKDGHIAVVAGIDDTYIWVAESFYRGVNVRRFTIERGAYGVIDCDDYSYITNMDHLYYNGDGVFTDSWE